MQPQSNGYYGGGAPVQYGPPRRRLTKRMVLVIVLIVLFLAAGLLGIISTTSGGGSRGQSKKMIELVQQNNGTASYELFSEQTKSAVSKEQWVVEVVRMNGEIKNEKSKVSYTKPLDDLTTEIAYNFGEKGSVYQVRVVIDNETGLVQGISHNPTTL